MRPCIGRSRCSISRPAARRKPNHISRRSNTQPGGELALADYYSGLGRRDDALKVLHQIEAGSDKSDTRAARLRIATLQYSAGHKAEAHKLVDAVIAEKPRNVDARLAKARMLLGDGKPDEAAVHAREAVKLEPDSAGRPATRSV